MDTNVELAKRYWELQNYITGFAIAQMLAVLLAGASSKEFRGRVGRARNRVVIAMVVSGIVYAGLVIGAFAAETTIMPPTAGRDGIYCSTLAVRVFLILVANVGGAGVVYGSRDEP